MKTAEYQIFGDGEEDTLDGKYLTFSLGTENYGIEIRYVKEIIEFRILPISRKCRIISRA